MIHGGRYYQELVAALHVSSAKQGVFLVLDGKKGAGTGWKVEFGEASNAIKGLRKIARDLNNAASMLEAESINVMAGTRDK